jgi:hypothetical protein
MKNKHSILFNLILICAISCILAQSTLPRYDWMYEFGKKPSSFCTNHYYEDISTSMSNVNLWVHDFSSKDNENFEWIKLSASDHRYCVGYIWMKEFRNYENGFVTEFNMEIKNPTCLYKEVKSCKVSLFGACIVDSTESVEDRCGADGFAVVLQTSGNQFVGGSGGGIGYAGASNALAIEFDTWYNPTNNDPTNSVERHISVIIKSGSADNNEVNSIAWNDKPLNFKSDKFEGFLNNPTFRIEFLNRNLRVFINNVLQLGFYDDLDIRKRIPTSTGQFYLGITSATGFVTNDHILTNWKLRTVKPSPSLSYVNLVPGQDLNGPLKTNQWIKLAYYVKDNCGNRYVPITQYDKTTDFVLVKHDACVLGEVTDSPDRGWSQFGPSYFLNVKCSKAGTHRLRITYKGWPTSNLIDVKVGSGPIFRAVVEFPFGNKGTVDKPFVFNVKPLDQGDNIAETNEEVLRSRINVLWPNPAESKQDYSIKLNSDGTYQYSINAEKSGIYSISSFNLFLREVSGGIYNFQINIGKPSIKMSYATVVERNSGVELTDYEVTAGREGRLVIFLRDISGNNIPGAQVDVDLFQVKMLLSGKSTGELDKIERGTDRVYYEVTLTRKGQNQLVPYYENQEIQCRKCNFLVNAGVGVFNNAELFEYNTNTATFQPDPSPPLQIEKGVNFLYLLVVRDIYLNIIDNMRPQGYTAVLSGNEMSPINLLLSSYDFGVKLEVPREQEAAYKRLVGREGYIITVNQNTPALKKDFSLTIVSDGSDSDAGNGDVDPLRTNFQWVDAPTQNMFCTAGQKYKLLLTLNTARGRRYNDYIEEARIRVTIAAFFAASGDVINPLVRGPRLGTYFVDFILRRSDANMRNIQFLVDNRASARRASIRVNPSTPFLGRIADNVLEKDNVLKKGLIFDSYNFDYLLFDQFDNPQDAPNNVLDITFAHAEGKGLMNTKPVCTRKQAGVYSCQFKGTAWGVYNIQSQYFYPHKFQSYTLELSRGAPDSTTTEAGIYDLKNPQEIKAGDLVKFRIIPKDRTGSPLTREEVDDFESEFSSSLQIPGASERQSAKLTLNKDGVFEFSITLTKVGEHIFFPLYQGKPILCEICAATIVYNNLAPGNTKVSLLQGADEKEIVTSDILTLDNKNLLPVFVLRFFDQYNNERPFDTSYNGFTAVISTTSKAQGLKSAYNMEFSLNAGVVKFMIKADDQDSYKTEKASKSWVLNFNAENSKLGNIGIKYPKVTLIGQPGDEDLSDSEAPTPESVNYFPKEIKAVAGTPLTLNFELRTPDGKLFWDQQNKGWYAKPLESFRLKLVDSEETIPFQVTKGGLPGTYALNFVRTKSSLQGQKVELSFLGPISNTLEKAAGTFNLVISPSDISYTTLDTSALNECASDSTKKLIIRPYDRYNNLIPKLENLNDLAFQSSHSDERDNTQCILSQSDNGDVTVNHYCKLVGTVTLKTLRFKKSATTDSETVNEYSFKIAPGAPSALNSLAKVSLTEVTAGDTVRWSISPFDVNSNKITISLSNKDHAKELFTNIQTLPGENAPVVQLTSDDLKIGGSDEFYYIDVKLTKAGTHNFKALYNNQPISSSSFRVRVGPSSPVYIKSLLSKFDSKLQTFTLAERSEDFKFIQNIESLPLFKVILFDEFENVFPEVPVTWDFTLTLTNSALEKSGELVFNREGKDTFKLTDEASIKLWGDLLTNQDYRLELEKGNEMVTSFITVTGEPVDPDASNLPLDVQNTIITPISTLETRANVAVSFNVELRTIDKNLRVNSWFTPIEKLRSNITLRFTQNDADDDLVFYQVSYGDKKGRYIVTVTSKIAYTAVNPNIITLIVSGIEFTGHKPKLVVLPGTIEVVEAVNESESVLKTLPDASVDAPYIVLFKAWDAWNNVVELTSEKNINLQLFDSSKREVLFEKAITGNGLVRISFQPKAPGVFVYDLTKGKLLNAKITQGEIWHETSYCTLSGSSQLSIVAGEKVVLRIHPLDKWGNMISLTEKQRKETVFSYYYKRPDIAEGFILGTSSELEPKEETNLKYEQTLTVKGIHRFKCSIDSVEIAIKLANVLVTPAAASLEHSNFYTYDSDSGYYIKVSGSAVFKEANKNEKFIPRYKLILADIFGNEWDSFPETEASNYSLRLYGDVVTVEAPIGYKQDGIIANGLLFSINEGEKDANLNTYRGLLFRKTPYQLDVLKQVSSAQPEVKPFKVVLLGGGEDDIEAGLKGDLSVTNTILSKTDLKFVAGKSDSFMIELRDVSGLRKADANVDFKWKIDSKDSKLAVLFESGDKRGRFLATVTGELSNNKVAPTVLTLIIIDKNPLSVKANIEQAIPTTLKVVVTPGPLKSIEIEDESSLKVGSNADEDFLFSVIPRDQYNNVAEVQAESINLKVIFPARNEGQQGGNVWNARLEQKTGYVIYTVACRIAGQYIIDSQLLTESKYFLVAPGAPSAKYSTIVVSPTGLNAGEKVSVKITAVDSYNNLIKPSGRKDLSSSFVLGSTLGDEQLTYNLTENTVSEILEGSFTYIKVGMVTVKALVKGDPIACDSCTVTYNPNEIDIKRSKFLVQVAGDVFKDAPLIEIPATTPSLDIIVRLFDRYDNAIERIYSNQTFSLQLSGHDMEPVDFIGSINEASPKFTLSEENKKALAILVAADGYQLTLTYNKESKPVDSVNLLMNILGDADGAGNGPWVAVMTWLSEPNAIVTAGVEKFINVELRTKKNLRFNGELEISKLVPQELEKSAGTEKLTLKFYRGDKPGRYVLGMQGVKALTGEKDKKYVTFTIDEKEINNEIVLDVIPNNPDLGKTVITQEFPKFGVMTDTTHQIKFRLFDRFDNQFTKIKFGPLLKAKAIRGSAFFQSTSLEGQDYVIAVTPSYPPRVLELQIVYHNEQTNETVLVNQNNILTQINTTLAPNKTEIIGTDLAGVAVNKALNFNVLLKDIKGYCFEQEAQVDVTIHGPYLSDDVDSDEIDADVPRLNLQKTAVSAKPFVNRVDSNSTAKKTETEEEEDQLFAEQGFECMQFFNVSILPEEIQRVGYYQIDVVIAGINNDKPVIKKRKTYMTPGATSPAKTVISVPALYNRAVSTFSLPVNTPMVFHVQPHDRFGNKINEHRDTDSVSFSIPTLENKFYNTTVEHFSNGTFKVVTTIFKTVEIREGQLLFNEEVVSWRDVKRIDCPEVVVVTPGKCSTERTKRENITQVKAGVRTKFDIECLDVYENPTKRGGDIFSVMLVANAIDVIGRVAVEGNVKDNNDGKYSVDFIISWPGIYTVSINLNSQPYGNQFNVTAVSGICASGYINCVNTNTCVEGNDYSVCGLEILKGCKEPTPLKCNVDGKETCVRAHFECDCPEGFVRCASDKKCVPGALESDLCFFPQSEFCGGEFPFTCSDGTCKRTKEACPSQPGCPPGFRLCADQTCVQTELDCPEFQACDTERIFKCEDQSCVADPSDCPSRISCPGPNDIICPDKTCAPSELKCKVPFTCTDEMHLCPDQSCRKNSDNCPRKKTCPTNYALCPDESCRLDCNLPDSSSSRILSPLARRMLQSQKEEADSCPKDEVRCPSGECVKVLDACPTIETCPIGSITCPDLSCALTIRDCVIRICKPGQFHCWDGKCVAHKNLCSTRTKCPRETDVKCHDGSCRESVEFCDDIIPCPPHAPYRCAYGACRASASECPTLITCPVDRPIQCVDGSCRRSVDDCKVVTSVAGCLEGKIICPDGSCAFSKHLCSTSLSCHHNQVRCWDGTCVNSLDLCRKLLPEEEVCPSDTNYRCPDSSCRQGHEDCPTGLICPSDRPILCDDGTCKEAIEQCSKGSECSYGLIRCPDGSCASKSCGTPITCPREAPYRCYDSTCKRDPRDCPQVPKCSDTAPILCPDGTCASLRVLCTGFSACDKKTPVKCPDMSCARNIAECKAINGCPVGKVLCEDGSCAIHPSYCPSQKCPFHLPIKCDDGFCVSEKQYCDKPNGCPYNKPFKCKNGLCTENEVGCPFGNYNETTVCKENEYLCPDGSCASDTSKCMNAVGCPFETPLKCVNGLCINPNKTSCAAGSCPKDSPVKCLNGICVKSVSHCPSFLDLEDYEQCKNEQNGNIVPCADGRCVASAEQCRPLYTCPENKYRCPDGSCRVLRDLCPKTNSTCPAYKPYRCEIGACAKNDKHCPSNNGCPNYAPWKCENTGTCANDTTKCPTIYSKTLLPNLCTIDKPYKCANKKGECVENIKNCEKDLKCEIGKVFCNDGTCRNDKKECLGYCKKNEVRCPDNSCKNTFDECKATNGCPIEKPFKCADGKCLASPIKGFGEEGCSAVVVCPKYKPFLCADGECVGDRGLCRVQTPCPAEKPWRCPDLTCAISDSLCSTLTLCPVTSPILCSNGNCVESPMECKTANEMFCPDDKPVFCATGKCVKSSLECIDPELRGGGSSSSRRRLLLGESNQTNQTIDRKDAGCSDKYPFRCFDGSCRANANNCPIRDGCFDPARPLRCQSGVCAVDNDECKSMESGLVQCVEGTRRCEDGICRDVCPAFQGCPLENPWHCPNGYCGKTLAHCAQDAGCPLNTPFRCADNTCVENIHNCQRAIRTFQPELIQLTVSPIATKTIEFIQAGSSQVKYGKITVPAGAFLSVNSSNSTTDSDVSFKGFVIRPVAQSEVQEYGNEIHASQKEYSNKHFPLSLGKLEYHQTVRSPIVKLESVNRTATIYRFPLIIELEADVPVNSNKTNDFCLAELDNYTRRWECHTRELFQEEFATKNKFAFPVEKDGIYTVIFNPRESIAPEAGDDCGWFCKNKYIILYVLLGLLVAGLVFAYIMWRVSRYIVKYRQAKKQMDNFREQITEMEKAQTDVVGQTLRDKIEGITFTTNPAYSKEGGEKNQKIQSLNEAINGLTVRDRMLEENNRSLDERNRDLMEEIEKLRNESNNLNRLKSRTIAAGEREQVEFD